VCVPIRLEFAIALGEGLLDGEGRVHAAEVLGKQILAVEFVAFPVGAAGLGAGGAAVELQAEVLGGDVALPFVFGAEGACAAREREGTGKGASVCGCDVLAEGGGVFEGRVAAVVAADFLLGGLFLERFPRF
jgi:hypothetical protein